MNDLLTQEAESARASERVAPSIYYVSPLLAGPLPRWPSLLDHAASLGFDHILIAPPFMPGRTGDLFLPADFNRLHPVFESDGHAEDGLATLAGLSAERDLKLLLDVVPDRLAAGSAASVEAGGLFSGPADLAALDPRHGHGGSEAARAHTGDPALIDWWADRLRNWVQLGVAGFRLLHLASVPAPFVHGLTRAVRDQSPDTLFAGWMAGASSEAASALAGAPLDLVSSSLPWWDFSSDWLWREAAQLGEIAPLLTAPEAPFARRLLTECHDPAGQETSYRRSLAIAASLGAGWLMPMGFEFASSQPLDPARDMPEDWDRACENAPLDLRAAVASANAARAANGLTALRGGTTLLSGPGSNLLAVVRTDAADTRFADNAVLILANTDATRRATAPASTILRTVGGSVAAFDPLDPPDGPGLQAGDTITLRPGEVRVLAGRNAPPAGKPRPPLAETARDVAAGPRVAVENVTPSVDGGAFPVKRIAGDAVTVEADVIADGHEVVSVVLRFRNRLDADWQERRMRPLGNDRWQASFPLTAIGTFEFTVEGWRDAFATWRDEVAKKHAAGVNTTLELKEGLRLVEGAAADASGALLDELLQLAGALAKADDDTRRTRLLSPEVTALMFRADARPFAVTSPVHAVSAERIGAQFASWYEIFPRSMSDDEHRHGTFRDVIGHLPRVRDMGFDVLYFPPIHPIGRKNRKGRNNTLTPAPDDPGSPYAIGSPDGGHDALHPELGTLEDFQALRREAAAHGLELAIDFAIQCSPDHPWLAEHKGWFAWRPDGTIKYAENPPKKYEDIVNVDFYAPDAVPDLWVALCEVILHWAEQGVRLFRVDNPHTKPFPFWEWMIAEVRAKFPDAIFLAEAFTRPKVMYRLAKVGFSQSYTYFTWRNTKRELQDYLVELTTTPPREFFRPHFFVNTPDINPIFLQTSGRGGFLIRAALAATLSGLWGVYCGFELCEAAPMPGKEEYLDSEKYQLRAWDWHRPGNIVPEITRLNRIRRENPALHSHLGITFHNAFDDQVIYYARENADRSNVLLVAISLDPHNTRDVGFEAPLWTWSLSDDGQLRVDDLVRESSATWTGKYQRVTLTPDQPYAIWRARPAS
ncbi:MAG: DUF3416 domain-containing protein [Acetobacteraceae bacterium]|nr:DUF3416 domain-containing protein [Acetobacteraceae bacterium]